MRRSLGDENGHIKACGGWLAAMFQAAGGRSEVDTLCWRFHP